MTGSAHDMRRQAAAMRREADRLGMLRLRLSSAFVSLRGSDDAGAAAVGSRLHGHWTAEEYAALGRISQRLRAMATSLEESADAQERTHGRRLGGYAGAGFLGRGQEARQQVDRVREFLGSHHGMEIGWGESIAPVGGEPARPTAHASHALGEAAVTADEPFTVDTADPEDD